jgi:SAM-dependent methyltransferase
MNLADRSVFVPSLRARVGVFKEHVRGRIQRRDGHKPTKAPDRKSVQRFFETLSSRQGFNSVTDGGKSWYLSCFSESRPIMDRLAGENALRVLDVGCSRGALLPWLRKRRQGRPMNYLGTDIDQVAVSRCTAQLGDANADFMVESIADPVLPQDETFDLVFCINVFPYVSEPAPAIRTLLSRLEPKTGLLVLMDPVPSPYWNTTFGEFRILQRTPDDLAAHVSAAGAIALDSATLYGASLFGRGLMPLAAMAVWHGPDALED